MPNNITLRFQAKRGITTLALIGLSLWAFSLKAAVIHYQAVDLPDTVAHEDLWQYTYTVSGYLFSQNSGFSIAFEPTNYTKLQNPPPSVNPDWDILVTESEALLGDDGSYDALALVDTPSLVDVFIIAFVWNGRGTPGSQHFAIYDAAFKENVTGQTSNIEAAVPELSTAWLMWLGWLAWSVHSSKAKANTFFRQFQQGLKP